VEGSKFCLFSVVLPAKCISSISPRFHHRRFAFCFLPLAAILESPWEVFLIEHKWCGLAVCLFGGTGVWTQCLVFAKQAPYYLSLISSPFCFGCFGDWVSETTFPGWPPTVDPYDLSLPCKLKL
jgi:hypothetical protein